MICSVADPRGGVQQAAGMPPPPPPPGLGGHSRYYLLPIRVGKRNYQYSVGNFPTDRRSNRPKMHRPKLPIDRRSDRPKVRNRVRVNGDARIRMF